ncbi:MAG: pitrilysin family protein [Planctomycetia bacterium]|nr:pitrilysin family protein [Planctomycetia bacterium]
MTHFHHQKLANGLTIIAEELPFARSLSLGFFVRCGSRHETVENAGISHFLEHMIFKGSPRRSPQDVNREFDALGISFNACTAEEMTVFYASLLPEFLEPCVEIYADILRPGIRESDFRAEKEVILEEIEMYENEPPYSLDDRLRQTFFAGHPLGNPVLGNVKSVRKLTSARLKAWWQEKYSPENIVLCACGKVDFLELVRLAEKYCGAWENSPKMERLAETESTGKAERARSWRDVLFSTKKTPQETVVEGLSEQETSPISLTLPTPVTPKLGFETFQHPEATQLYFLSCSASSVAEYRQRLVGRLIASILGDDAGSRLYWEFVDSGLAEYAVLGFTDFTDAGFFNTSLCCEPEKGAENWEKLEKIYRNAEEGGITETELALAKNRIATATVLGSEKGWNRIFAVGGDWTTEETYHTVQAEIDTLRSITLEEINAILADYPLTRSLTFQIGP